MPNLTDYSTMTDGQFWSLFEERQANHDSVFYDEFKRRTAKGRHYNPNTDPQDWEKALLTLLPLWMKQGFHIKVAMVKRGVLLAGEEFNSVNRELM
jgi:hypothetical protein